MKRLRKETKTASVFVKWRLTSYHDNIPTHASILKQQYLTKHKVVQLRQILYSPDTAPCDFWLFPRLKTLLKGYRSTTKKQLKLI